MIKEFSRFEIAAHHTARSTWIIFNNKVYDVTPFLFDHPGGEEFILQHAGTDVTEVMKDQFEHLHSDSAYELLKEYYIGELKVDEKISRQNSEQDVNQKSIKFIDPTRPMIQQVWSGNFSKEFYMQQVHIPRHTKESAPIFGPPILEMFTKTPWWVIPLVWMPVSIYCAIHASSSLPLWQVAVLYVLGLINWSFLEYTIHRFLFHVDAILPDNRTALTLHFLMHGIHHFLPMDRMRLVMPPALAIILSYPVWSFYLAILPSDIGIGLAAGTYAGYVFITKDYLHHGKPFGDHLKEMKTYHLDHHYKEPNLGFGITSKLWDHAFKTVLT